jgi:23S rRNA G2445 N2-methylase RlmL
MNISNTCIFFASCSKNLETLLQSEATSFGLQNISKRPGGIYFSSSQEKSLDFLLHTRLSSRIYKELFQFSIQDQNDLYLKAKNNPWETVFSLQQTFKIKTLFDSSAKKTFKNSVLFSQKLKDAMVDQFRQVYSKRPSVDTKNPDINLLVRVEKGKGKNWTVSISLDLCSEPLSHRGYRLDSFEAPLRENLAAGIVMLTDWNPENELFIDSMCGSGTLSIEAALIKYNIPPTYLKIIRIIEKKEKPFGFLKQLWFSKSNDLKKIFYDRIENLYQEIQSKLNGPSSNQFYASDWDNKALQTTKKNLTQTSLEKFIHLKKQNALKLTPPDHDKSGIIICNPPYGLRLGDENELKDLYKNYGENLKNNFKGFRAYIFTGNPELRKQISLSTSQRIPLFNGMIDCRLLKYDLY